MGQPTPLATLRGELQSSSEASHAVGAVSPAPVAGLVGNDGRPCRVRHCRQCGHAVQFVVPPEDNRLRAVCPGCSTVHYDNPINVVGTLCTWGTHDEQVLLCRRAIEPRRGTWTLPAGFMELGETVSEGACRETREEAGANVEMLDLFAVIDVLPASQVHLLFRARLRDPDLRPGPETLEARLFAEHEIPWSDLSFRSVVMVLRHYFDGRRRGMQTLLVDRIE